MKSFSLKRYRVLPIVLSLFLYLGLYYFSDLKTNHFDLDEYLFIRKTYYFDLYFLKRDFQDNRWYTEDAPDQPKVGPYLYGITLHLAGIQDIEEYLQKIGFRVYRIEGEQWWYRLRGHRLVNLTPETLTVLQPVWLGRQTAVIFSLSAFLVLLVITYKIKGLLFGLISTLLLGRNTLMYWYGRLAMTDSMQLFFFFSNLLLSLLFLKALRARDHSRMALVALALGANCSLGVGVKVSGMLMYFFLIVFFLTLIVMHRNSKSISRFVSFCFGIVTTSFLALFVLLHPYTHHDTFRQFISIFTDRYEYANEARLYQPKRAVYGRLDAIKLIYKRILSPQSGYVNFKFRHLPIDIILFVVGLGLMIRRAVRKLSLKKISGEFLLLMWTAIVIGSLILYLRNDWPRYYLPTVASITIMQAYAITSIFQGAINFITAKSMRARDK